MRPAVKLYREEMSSFEALAGYLEALEERGSGLDNRGRK